MSKYWDNFQMTYGNMKRKDVKKLTDEINDAFNKDKVEKAKAEIQKHRRIAMEVEELIN